MAYNVRRIVAEFSAKNKAKGIMGGFRRDMDTTGRAMRRMAAGALAVAGVGGMGYMLKKTMESIDQIAKMSDELQISTEALTGWEHAAKISGTSIESLHKGIGIFVRRMGEAKYGVGEGVRGLKMLNLTAEEMISMGTEEAFMKIAERISQAGTAAEQAGIAYNFFGRQGTQLLNMFQQGQEGIEAMREEAERLGLTFSRIDAAQVEAANDALTRARATMTGLFRQATIELSPYIEVLADKFVDIATAGEGLGANVTNVFENLSLSAIRFGDYLSSLPAYWKGFEAAAHQSLAVVYDIANAATNLDVLFKKLKLPKWEYTYKELAEQQRQIAVSLLETGGRELAGVYGRENTVRRFYEGLRQETARRRETIEGRARQRAAAGVGIDTGLVVEPLDADAMQEHYDKLTAMGGNYQEMQERMARQRIETEIAVVTQQWEAANGLKEKRETATIDIAAAERAMFDNMQRMTGENYQFRLRTLESLKQKYIEAGLARVQIEQWYVEQAKKLDIERLRSSQRVLDGFKAARLQMELDMKAMGDKAYRFSMTLENSIANGLENSMRNFDNWKDHLLNVFEEVYWAAVRIFFIEDMARGLASGMTAGVGALFGGASAGIPTTATRPSTVGTTLVPSAQYGGTILKTGLAMVHRGETYSGERGGERSINVNINYTGQERHEVSVEESVGSLKQQVLNITMQAMQTNGPYRRSIKQAIR